ncbi:hypothetical protein M378DRAFT_154900 [Amanita muscaria Koide BX008]|uniref:Uncharacterized protein n=1 Tax=Amanita muscaria (strain Koide BX008) TaxID=946122 RepID=A0A0C2XQ75_AMAMK|nr:hypothetical protein M378DRAFT_154900 [Amanita muscaria Koide BX008]
MDGLDCLSLALWHALSIARLRLSGVFGLGVGWPCDGDGEIEVEDCPLKAGTGEMSKLGWVAFRVGLDGVLNVELRRVLEASGVDIEPLFTRKLDLEECVEAGE